MNVTTIYVHIRHWHFWWGVYGFTRRSCNDEITLYLDQEGIKRIAYFDLMTLPGLLNHYNNDFEDDDYTDDKEYIEEIQAFIDGDIDIGYSYIYPRDTEDESYQVDHSAPLNEKGHKPTYIYVWSKLAEAWDMESITAHVHLLARQFLQIEVENVVFLDQPSYEDTKAVYDEECARFGVKF
ncbi:hypothetical protein PCCS19_02820 [Paenibacillus sp. CCS19]|uniref:hypothetical protein n=1 Tax=Paenibacillus sp. CCS19 TaxID=3158387 RepID=UPI0025665D53|nr:hypothetical protein [Paenibacillus cellulosilyticus]GMK37229.1 hypothetical protein PCCS19_02820 [Paenibacillus cellulosilyticus]